MSACVKLRSDLISASAIIDGATVYNIKDPITGTYFRLREPEFWLVNQLDGHRTNEEVAEQFREKFNLNISAENVGLFVDQLESLYFLENNRAEQATSRTSYQPGREGSLASRLLFIKLKAFRPGRWLDWLSAIYRRFHNPAGFIIQSLILLTGLGLLVANSEQFWVDLTELTQIGSLARLIVIIFVMITFHELAHAVICRFYGGEVREIGFLLLYFQPCFYSDLSDAWLFPKKSHRLAVTWAGLYYQILLLSAAVIIWRLTVPGNSINEIARITAVVSWITLLFNINPLIKLDGYYLLSDWLDIPNLRQKSFAYLGNLFKRRLLGWPIENIAGTTMREKRVFSVYAGLALVYSAFLVVYILFIIARFLLVLMGGVGLVLFAVILFFLLRSSTKSAIRVAIQHMAYMKNILKRPVRLGAYLFGLVVFVVGFFGLPLPHRVSGEVTVRPVAEYALSVNQSGLLERKYRRSGDNAETRTGYLIMTSNEMANLDLLPYVRDGQMVRAGDTLAVLISNQVTKEVVAGTSLLEMYTSQLALLRSPPKKEELEEAKAQVNAALVYRDQLTRELARMQELTEKDLATTEQLEGAQSALAIADAELAKLRARLQLLKSPPKPEEEAILQAEINKQRAKLDFLIAQQKAQSIIAPFSGRIRSNRSANEFLSLSDNNEVELLVPVSDFDINLVSIGQPVKLKVRSFPGRVFEGCVVHIPEGALQVEGVARFPISVIVTNDNSELQDGMTGYAKIDVGRSSLFGLIRWKLLSLLRVEFWSWW